MGEMGISRRDKARNSTFGSHVDLPGFGNEVLKTRWRQRLMESCEERGTFLKIFMRFGESSVIVCAVIKFLLVI